MTYLQSIVFAIDLYGLVHELHPDCVETVVIEVVRDEPAHQTRLANSTISQYHDLQQSVPIRRPAVCTLIILHHYVK